MEPETLSDMILFLVAWHIVGGLVDWAVQRTLVRAYEQEDQRASDALESIAESLASLEERVLVGKDAD